MQPEWLDRRELESYICRRDIRQVQKNPRFPKPSLALGGRQPRWRRADIDAFMAGQPIAAPKPTARERTPAIVEDILKGRV